MRSRQGVYLGVSKNHSYTVHLILNPDTGAISPQYHCIFDDSFSTVWSDGQFDHNLWECLVSQVENIERHSCLQPNRDGTVNLPPDFAPFSPDMTGADQPDRRELPNIDSNQNNITNNNDDRQQPSPRTTSNTLDSPSSPLLSRRIFITSLPISSTNDIDTPTPQVRRSTKSNLGSAPDRLDRSTHTLTYNHQATTDNGSNVTSIENYCNVLGIKLPSTTRARTASQGGCIKTFYTCHKQNLPKVKRNQLNAYYLTCLNWSRLLHVCHSGLTTLGAFAYEVQKNISIQEGCKLLECFNPALLVTIANKDDNPTLKEAMNGPDAAGFMKAMEIEVETLIRMEAFAVVDRESWMNVVSQVWAFKRKRFPDGLIKR
jgi:hypothetical protein